MLELEDDLDEEWPTGRVLLQRLAERAAESGPPVPPVPAALVDAFRALGDGRFGTGPLPRPLLRIEGWVDAALAAAPEPFLFYGHDGSGVTRQYLHYYLASGPLVLFLQYRLDLLADEPSAPGFATALARVPPLLARLEAAREEGRLAPDERVVLVDSDLVGQRWTRVAPGRPGPGWRDEGIDPMLAVSGL
jgi:hypothetical protein